ncbi:hypothetical protein [Duganella callida]|uniref:hypothetical protein n=1 Tax=Duganella callida TaxID=2561932 RepID=UPI001E641C16|nr:hypothetical protein [Duganella callida]
MKRLADTFRPLLLTLLAALIIIAGLLAHQLWGNGDPGLATGATGATAQLAPPATAWPATPRAVASPTPAAARCRRRSAP